MASDCGPRGWCSSGPPLVTDVTMPTSRHLLYANMPSPMWSNVGGSVLRLKAIPSEVKQARCKHTCQLIIGALKLSLHLIPGMKFSIGVDFTPRVVFTSPVMARKVCMCTILIEWSSLLRLNTTLFLEPIGQRSLLLASKFVGRSLLLSLGLGSPVIISCLAIRLPYCRVADQIRLL